jgi:hypothetical protein
MCNCHGIDFAFAITKPVLGDWFFKFLGFAVLRNWAHQFYATTGVREKNAQILERHWCTSLPSASFICARTGDSGEFGVDCLGSCRAQAI